MVASRLLPLGRKCQKLRLCQTPALALRDHDGWVPPNKGMEHDGRLRLPQLIPRALGGRTACASRASTGRTGRLDLRRREEELLSGAPRSYGSRAAARRRATGLTRRAIFLYRLPPMAPRRSLIPLFVLSVVGCGGGSAPAPVVATPAEAPSAAVTATATATATATPVPDAAPKQVEAPTPVAAVRKASTLQIDGVSISDITGAQLEAVLKKLGWEAQPSPETHVGKYEQISIAVRKDKTNKVVASVTISRTEKAPKPDADATNEKSFAPKALQANYASTPNVEQTYDPDSDVLVSVMYVKGGKSAAARAMLDALVKQPK